MSEIKKDILSLPHSYHTFLFPFLWNVSGKVSQNDFIDILSGAHWVETEEKDIVDQNPYQCDCDPNEWRLKYAVYQYFTPAALDIILDAESKKSVRLFNYDLVKDEKTGAPNAQYLIEKSGKTYKLAINAFRLKVYATGIAVLIIEAENHNYKSIDDINAINEYGRRISLPFFSIIDEYNTTHALCADKISLVIDGKTVASENFLGFLKKFSDDSKQEEAKNQSISWNFAMNPLQYLLDNDGNNRAKKRISTNKRKPDSFLIKPCIDDRMFVCCLIRDKKLSEQLKSFDVNHGEYHYLKGCDNLPFGQKELSNTIYKILYIETDLTCQSAVMKKELLKKSVYDRWIDYGTIHGVTHHSILCITSTEEYLSASVINPFLTQIVEMAILSLVQRSHQLLLFDRISEISKNFDNTNEIEENCFLEIEKLQEFYVRCQDQILLSEVTLQEQGIELYDMLQEQLYIPKNKAVIDAQMNNLRDVSNISHERNIRKTDDILLEQERHSSKMFNIFALVIALITLAEPIFAQHLKAFFESTFSVGPFWATLLSIVSELLIVIPLSFLLNLFLKEKKDNS